MLEDPAQVPFSMTPPCPVGGDTIVFCKNVEAHAATIPLRRLRESAPGEPPYVVFDNGDDSMTFVVLAPLDEPRHFKLTVPKPGFDSTFIWALVCQEEPERLYLLCLQLPVSGRQLIPPVYAALFLKPNIQADLGPSSFWVYDVSDIETTASWRLKRGTPTPDEVFAIASSLAAALNRLHYDKHYLLRFNADTVVMDGDNIRFLGVMSLDLPWNESCARSNGVLDFDVYVPPECRGYVKQPLSPTADIYAFGVVLYFLIANTNPPICEALDFECPLSARVFEPGFPFGWDNIILKAILPSPVRRYACINDLMKALSDGYTQMINRANCDVPLKYDVSVDTYIGITKRLRCPVNQDAVMLRASDNNKRILIVVADGVSTSKYGSGDLASTLLVKAAEEVWVNDIENAAEIEPKELIHTIFAHCNEYICNFIRDNYADQHPSASESMGTTALVGIVENGVFTLGAIGDSRAYLIRSDSVTCITRDHNLFTMAIVNGMPVQNCAMHPHAGSLVRCLGFFDDLTNPDSDNLAYDTFTFNLMPGDHLLLTTDGLLDYAAQDIRDAEAIIARTVLAVPDPALACLELILIANRGGGGDNTGVGLLYVEEEYFGSSFLNAHRT